MNTVKIYYDSDGNECTIWQMVKREPEWAANRIQLGEDAIAKLASQPYIVPCPACGGQTNLMCQNCFAVI